MWRYCEEGSAQQLFSWALFLAFFFFFDKVVNVYLAFTLLFFLMFFNVNVESYFQMAAWHFLVECLFIYILFSL